MTHTILINAASLKGYLRASGAKIEAIRWAEEIIAVESARLERPAPEFVANEEVRLNVPDAQAIADMIRASRMPPAVFQRDFDAPLCPDVAPAENRPPPAELPQESVKAEDVATTTENPVCRVNVSPEVFGWLTHLEKEEAAIAAPETTLTEENSIPSAGEVAEEVKTAPEKLPRYRGPGKMPRLEGKLEEIKTALASESFSKVGKKYGVSDGTITNFLRRHGEEPAKYKKQRRSWLQNPAPGKYEDARAKPSAPIIEKVEEAPEPVTPSRSVFRLPPVRQVASIADNGLKALEDEAYEATEDAPEEFSPGYKGKKGPAQSAPSFRPVVLSGWPAHTDFRSDNLAVMD